MASPSPSDLVWVIGFTPQGRWIAPVMRAAIRAEWPHAKHLAATQLGDEGLAHELMESAIQQTGEHISDLAPIDAEEARAILGRFYRNAVRRERRAYTKVHFGGTGNDVELLLPPVSGVIDTIDAHHDLSKILRDTPLDIQRAMLMRFGARCSWEEISQEMQKSKDAIRMKCQREIDRIRNKLSARRPAK